MINNKKVFAIVMAAGKGTRIGATDKPKVMFEVAGKPIIGWAIEPLEKLKKQGLVDRIITVVGFFGDQVIDYLGEKSEYVWQKEQLGTGHAVLQAEELLREEEDGLVLIVNGDHALYSEQTFAKVIKQADTHDLSLLLTVANSREHFNDYGRVVRDQNGKIREVVELKDADEIQQKIPERNINLYVAKNRWLFDALKKIKNDNAKNEYYLTDLIKIAVDEGKKVETAEIENLDEAIGINTLDDLDAAEKILHHKLNH